MGLLDAILPSNDHPALLDDDEDWKWDKETKVRSQGFKSSFCSFQTIAAFIVTKNVLDEVKAVKHPPSCKKEIKIYILHTSGCH